MRKRVIRLIAGLFVIVAIAVVGATLATAGSGGGSRLHARPAVRSGHALRAYASSVRLPVKTQARTASANENSPSDGDTVQQGDQSSPDTPSGQSDGQQAGSEQVGSESEKTAESSPSDGPGGYADTSANADTQQQGEH